MTDLTRNIRGVTKQGNNIKAIVIATSGERATVRLSINGAVYKTLKVVGGPVGVGQIVQVDFSSDIPYIVANSSYTEPVPIDYRKIPPKFPGFSGDDTVLTNIIVDVNNPPKTTVPIADSSIPIYAYPATIEGFRQAMDVVESNGTIYVPEGTYGTYGEGIEIGGMTSGSGIGYYRENIHIVGAGIDKTIFGGTVNSMTTCFLYDFTVEYTVNDTYNYGGLYCQHDTYLERVKTNISNTGTGLAIGLFSDMETRITTKQCTIKGDDYGLYIFGSMFNLHFEYEAIYAPVNGIDDIYYSQDDNEIELWWNSNVRSAGEYQSSAAWGVITAQPQEMSGKEIHIIWQITSGSSSSMPNNYPYKIENMSYWADDYGQSIPQIILDGNQMAESDESYVEYINGTSGSSPYGVGDYIKWVWTNSPDFEIGYNKFNSIWFAITRYVDENHPGIPQVLKLYKAYIVNTDGSIKNIAPFRCYTFSQETVFSGNNYADVRVGKWSTLEYRACTFSTTEGEGTIVYVPEGTTPTYYGDEPTATYPGMLWIEE